MMKLTRIFLLLFLSANFARASEVLTWEQCVEMAAMNNSALRSAIAAERSTYYLNNAAIAGFLPQAVATISSNRGTAGNSTNPANTTVQNDIIQAYNGSVSITQNVFNGFFDVGKFDQTKANNMVSKANIMIVKAQVNYDLKLAYANFSYAKETVALLDQIIKRREDNLEIIRLRFKGGMENKGSLLLAQSYFEQAKYDRLQGENLISSARAQLCKALGLSKCDENYDISGIIPTDDQLDRSNLEAVVEETPQHLQAIAQERAANAGITIAQSAFLPTLNLVATSGKRGAVYFPQNEYWSFGANLSFAFFTGGKDYYTTRSAYSNSNAAKENRQTIDQQALLTLKQARNSYIEAISKLKVDEGFREAARLRADIGRSKYNNGLLTFENWDLIETDLINRQKNYLQSKLNRILNEATWLQAQGKSIF
jgi:outer membrane protein